MTAEKVQVAKISSRQYCNLRAIQLNLEQSQITVSRRHRSSLLFDMSTF